MEAVEIIQVIRRFRELYARQLPQECARYRGWIHSRLTCISLSTPGGERRAMNIEGVFQALGEKFPECLSSAVKDGTVEIRPVFAARRSDGRRFMSGYTLRLAQDREAQQAQDKPAPFDVRAALFGRPDAGKRKK